MSSPHTGPGAPDSHALRPQVNTRSRGPSKATGPSHSCWSPVTSRHGCLTEEKNETPGGQAAWMGAAQLCGGRAGKGASRGREHAACVRTPGHICPRGPRGPQSLGVLSSSPVTSGTRAADSFSRSGVLPGSPLWETLWPTGHYWGHRKDKKPVRAWGQGAVAPSPLRHPYPTPWEQEL